MINYELVMFASLLVTPLIFLLLPVRKAIVTAYCMMWMFLPVAEIHMPGLPPLSKAAAISFGVLVSMLLLYADFAIRKYRFMWFDVAVVVFGFVAPFVAVLANGLTVNDALYESLEMLFLWVVPYFAGRIVLGDEMGVETLATGLFYAALIYTAFAWYEMLLSPQLHNKIYGWHQHEFQQTKRGWSYRPMVFMQHGLMTTMWLVAGAICGVWLKVNKRLKWKLPVPAWLGVGFCLFTAMVSNSAGAVLLMFVAFSLLFMSRWVNPAWLLLPLIAISPIYIAARSTNAIEADDLRAIVEPISSARAASLHFRLWNEDMYVERAMMKPILGWGGHGRHRPVDEHGNDYTSDGLWIIVLGKTGMIGLLAMLLTLLAVPLAILAAQKKRVWRHPRFAASSALTVLVCIYAIDNLLNAMVNPIYMLAVGALASFATVPLAKTFGLNAGRQTQPNPAQEPPENPAQKQRNDPSVGNAA